MSDKMMNYGFVIDNRKCIGCHACTVACKSENDVPIGVNRTWVKYIEKGKFPNTQRLFSVMRCNHCEDAPCVDICPVEALYTRPDGIVDFDNLRCIGCKACTQACPYDAIYIDPNSHTAAKCNYCAPRIDIGLEPACVNICPEKAIISGDISDPLSEISQLIAHEQVQIPKPEKGTRPKLFYINGDHLSIRPAQTAQTDNYMSSEQTTGVGHYAAYAEARISNINDNLKVQELALSTDNENHKKEITRGISTNQNDPSIQRVYDAPQKGIMWDWEVVWYILTKAISAGIFLVPFILQVIGGVQIPSDLQWFSVTVALLFLGITGVLLVIDLDKPARFLYVLFRPQWKSWLTRGALIISGYGIILVLWLCTKLAGIDYLTGILAWGGLVLATLTAVYTAFLFAQAKGRDFWQSPLLSFHMLTHAFIGGTAILLVFTPIWESFNTLTDSFITILKAGILFQLLIMTIELFAPHSTEDVQLTVHMIKRGQFSKMFWIGLILIGNLAPLILLSLSASIIAAALSGLLALTGIYLSIRIWVIAPQLIPLS